MSKPRFAIFGRVTLGIAALALTLTGTALAQIAQMTLPTPGTTLTGASVTFTWTTGTNVAGILSVRGQRDGRERHLRRRAKQRTRR